jgi:hypothetical protein
MDRRPKNPEVKKYILKRKKLASSDNHSQMDRRPKNPEVKKYILKTKKIWLAQTIIVRLTEGQRILRLKSTY